MQLRLNRFTEVIEKNIEKAKRKDTSRRFNGVIWKMSFLGHPHLKTKGKRNC